MRLSDGGIGALPQPQSIRRQLVFDLQVIFHRPKTAALLVYP